MVQAVRKGMALRTVARQFGVSPSTVWSWVTRVHGQRLDRALASLDFMVAVDFYINETTRHADIILPPTGPLEHDHYAQRRAKVISWLGQNPVRLSVDWPELQKRTTLQPVDRRAAGLLAVILAVRRTGTAQEVPAFGTPA